MSTSGRLTATVLMQKANVVPRGRPLSSRLSIIGMMPVTLVYSGMPTATARGTDHHWPEPKFSVNHSRGTKPCSAAPRPTPRTTHSRTRWKMPLVSDQANAWRSMSPIAGGFPACGSAVREGAFFMASRRNGCSQRSAWSASMIIPPPMPAHMPTAT